MKNNGKKIKKKNKK